jgi:uncharacterized protein with PIN domain
MKRTRDQIKAELLKQYAEEVERILNWEEHTPQPTLSQIEERVLASRKKVSEALLQQVLSDQESGSLVEAMKCPKCGQPMEDKGKALKRVETRAGRVLLERTRYYCPNCRLGVFPPG